LGVQEAFVNWVPMIPAVIEIVGEARDKNDPFRTITCNKSIKEDEPSARENERSVEFNRALLINGFRWLEALGECQSMGRNGGRVAMDMPGSLVPVAVGVAVGCNNAAVRVGCCDMTNEVRKY
jgi:hypothetical protein